MEQELILLCEEFLRKLSNMYFNCKISKEEFDDLSEKKIEFLKNCGIAY